MIEEVSIRVFISEQRRVRGGWTGGPGGGGPHHHGEIHLQGEGNGSKGVRGVGEGVCTGYTMKMRGYRIYTTEGEARGRVYSMTPNLNCITGLYQNAVAFPFPIGSSKTVQ